MKITTNNSFFFFKLALDWVAGLMEVPSASLQQALEIRSMETKKGGGARGTSYVSFFFVDQTEKI